MASSFDPPATPPATTMPFTNQELADAVDKLPPVVSVMWRLLGVLDDPDSDVDDIARLIRVDTALATQVLRLANSPHYGLVERVATIEAAIQHIGVTEISRLVSTLSSREIFAHPLACYGFSVSLLWQHTLAVALGAEAVAGHFGTDPGVAYLAGLLHPVGFVALDAIAAARGMPVRPSTMALAEWERAKFGADNTVVAARVLQFWSFPEELSTAVAARYEPPTAETGARPGHELYVASYMAERIPAGLPGEAGLFALSPERLAEIGLSSDHLSDLELSTARQLTRMRALLVTAG
jgi:HD-like signal output (HDOD) protein